MCIIVDPPTYISIFKKSDPDYDNFKPVLTWVLNGNGKFVMGGSEFRKQLGKLYSILSFITQLRKIGKIIVFEDALIDKELLTVKEMERSAEFDDPHLVALVRVSGCRLICVKDNRSHKYLKDKKFYSKKSKNQSYIQV